MTRKEKLECVGYFLLGVAGAAFFYGVTVVTALIF